MKYDFICCFPVGKGGCTDAVDECYCCYCNNNNNEAGGSSLAGLKGREGMSSKPETSVFELFFNNVGGEI